MINAIVDSLVALIATALPSYKKVDGFYTPVKDLDAGNFPHAMLFDPEVSSARLRERQKDQTIKLSCLLVRKPESAIAMRDDLDTLVAALEDDPTLTATVDDARAEAWGANERQSANTTGGMVIEVKLVS